MGSRFEISADLPRERYAPLIQRLIADGVPAEAVDIYEGRNRVVRLYDEPFPLNIKAFKVPHIINRIVYRTLRKSKARRAWEYAQQLIALGFNTPRPVGYAETWHGLLLEATYFVSEQVEGLHDLRRLDDEPRRDEIIEGVGALMARLHRAEVWMKDFSQGNILWRGTADGGLEFYLVDINRMAFGVKSHALLMNNFRTVADRDATVADIARAYARHAGRDESATIAEALAVHHRFTKAHQR